MRWSAETDTQIVAAYHVDDTPLVRYELDDRGRPRSFTFDRWGDPDRTGTWGWCRSGGEFSAYRTFDGVTIPSEGRFSWFYGTNRWADGEFLRYRITQLTLTR